MGNGEQLVSIIMPAFNCQDYIGESIKSVIEQTYKNWELIIINDFSNDNTKLIIEEYGEKDSRISIYTLFENKGAAFCRNYAIKLSKGNYIAFLDSDDLWKKNKLKDQIQYMRNHDYNFTCTSYDKVDEKSNELNQTITYGNKRDYDGLLKNNCGNSTVIYNADKLGKFFIPNIRKRNDYLMWLQILKIETYLYELETTLSSHRVREGSLSKNKISLIKYHWIVYRKIEKLSLLKSINLIVYWIRKATKFQKNKISNE